MIAVPDVWCPITYMRQPSREDVRDDQLRGIRFRVTSAPPQTERVSFCLLRLGDPVDAQGAAHFVRPRAAACRRARARLDDDGGLQGPGRRPPRLFGSAAKLRGVDVLHEARRVGSLTSYTMTPPMRSSTMNTYRGRTAWPTVTPSGSGPLSSLRSSRVLLVLLALKLFGIGARR